MLHKLLSLLLICWTIPSIMAQITPVYQNDFEPSSFNWLSGFSTGPNEWNHNTCAGNGPSAPGITSMYISPGNIVPGCAPGEKDEYAYANALTGIGFSIAHTPVNATCAGNLTALFDYKTQGVPTEDFLELIYSTDNGGSWIVLQTIPVSLDWTSLAIPLPAPLYFSNFNIGFRFNFNASVISGNPPAIDNFVISGNDNTDPIISVCNQSSDINLGANCAVFVDDLTSEVVATDNCTSFQDLTISQSPLPNTFEFTSIGQAQIFTMTVTDLAGNTDQCTFTLTAIDAESPVLVCPDPINAVLNGSCEVSIPDLSTLVTWSDNCTVSPASMTFSQSPAAGVLVSTFQSIIYTVTDPSGNSEFCAASLNVIDNTSPTIACPPSEEANVDGLCLAVLGDYTAGTIVTENCFFNNPVAITQDPTIGTPFSDPVLVTISAEDESGNIVQCVLTVTPIDVSIPEVICPANSTVGAQAGCTYVLGNQIVEATISDNCNTIGNLTMLQSPAIGSVLAVGPHTVSLTITDEAGNIGTCNFQLTVEDLSGPTVACPSNINIPVDATCSAFLGDYTGNITVSDNCSSLANISVSQSPAPGSFITGNTQIFITVTDEQNNSSTCNYFAVAIDDIDPVLTCPASATVSINSSCQYSIPDLSNQITASDNCSVLNDMTYSQNPVAGTTDFGLTAVLITIMDEQGNSATCITLIIPDDIEAPTVTCPTPADVDNGTSCDFTLPNYGTQTLVLDNCPDYSITQTPSPGTVIQPGEQLIELEINDVAGNMVTCSFTLIVTESVNPTITCPSTITTCDPIVTYLDPVFGDNCSAVLSQTDLTGLSSGDSFPVGPTSLSYMATDLSGNTQSCSFIINVLDYPGIANIVEDTMYLCDITSSVITAEPHSTGQGLWTVFQGQGTFNNEQANITGINNLLYGNNVLVYTISTVSCGSSSDTLVVIASQQPLPASTQDTIYACSTNEVVLLSNTPLYGIGTWSTTDPTANIGLINSSNTSATNLSSGWHDYIWTITNGSCPSTADTLRVHSTEDASIIQSDTTLCMENGSLLLTGSIPADGQSSYWKFILGNGTLETPFVNETNLNNLSLGNNIIVYTMTYPLCPSTTDTIVVLSSLCDGFNPVFPTVITPNLDGKNDLFVINFLEKVYPECRVTIFNRWGSVIFESIGYNDPWDGTYNGETLPMGTYFYKIELNDSESKVYTGPISIIH